MNRRPAFMLSLFTVVFRKYLNGPTPGTRFTFKTYFQQCSLCYSLYSELTDSYENVRKADVLY